MADEWWQNDPVAGSTPRVGYIPGVPKAKDPLDVESKELEIRSKKLSIAKAERDLAKPESADGGKPTDSERANDSYFSRALRALKVYEASGVGPRTAAGSAVAGLPGGQALLGILPDTIGDSPARQQSEQAKKDFATMILRSDSGANAPEAEVERLVSVYFPGPGETDPSVLANFAAARQEALEGLRRKAGVLAPAGELEPPAQPDQPIYEQGQPVPSVATGDTRTEDDPELAGVNVKLNEMLKAGASPTQIAGYVQSVGIPPNEIMPSLLQIMAFRKKNPGYQGEYVVDVDNRIVPNSAVAQLGASSLGAGLIAGADTLTGGHLDNLVGMGGGDAELANIGIQDVRQNNPLASLGGDILGGAALYGAGAGALGGLGAAGKVGAFAPRALAGDAALGGYVASGQGGTQIADLSNVATGAAFGAGAGAATRGALNSVGAAISPDGGALAPLFKAGVRPTVGQRLGASESGAGRMLNRAEQAFGSVPLVGGVQRSARNAAVDEMQVGAFNESLGEIGLALPKSIKAGPQRHKFAQNAFDHVYDKARSGMRFTFDEDFINDMVTLTKDGELLTADSQNVVKKIANDIGSKLNASGGQLSGDQYKLVQSRLGKKIAALRSNPNGDGELADLLEGLKTAIDNGARRQSPKEFVELLDKADAGYAKLVVIENASKLRGGDAGTFNGNQLDRAVQSTNKSRRSRAYLRGEAVMQEYASAAKKLGDELPDSGTGERLATMGGGAAAAHFISPYALLPWAADTAANLPGVRQTLGTLMAPRPQSIKPGADATRRFLEELARYGSISAVPASN
jgi:hypothetical protein